MRELGLKINANGRRSKIWQKPRRESVEKVSAVKRSEAEGVISDEDK
jgi:hypothetical protein